MKTKATFTQQHHDQIMALLNIIGGDGHGFYDASILEGFPKPLQKRFVRKLKSDRSSHKSTLFDNTGRIIDEVVAVYSLDIHQAICSDLNIDAGCYGGRGFQAQACCDAIKKYFAGRGESEACRCAAEDCLSASRGEIGDNGQLASGRANE
jgi:hypothetical protein